MVGAHRFEYGEGTRHDPVLKRLFGFKRMGHFKAILRRFNKVTQSSNEGVMAPRLAGSLSSPGMEHAPRGDRIKALKYNVAADTSP